MTKRLEAERILYMVLGLSNASMLKHSRLTGSKYYSV